MEPSQSVSSNPSKRKLLTTAAYYLTFIGLGLTSSSLGPTISGLAEHTGTTLSQVSFLFSARSLGYLLGSLGGGRWYDRLPGHRVQALALLLMAAMVGLTPVLPLFWLVVAALVVLGFAEGTLDVGSNTLLVWLHREKVGPFMNGLHFFFGVGSFLCPIIVAQAILLTDDITWAYWTLGLLLLPVALVIGMQPSQPIPAGHGHENGRPLNWGLLVLFMLFFFLNVGAEGSFGGWIFTYAHTLGLGTEVTAAYLTSAFWGALTVGRLLAIPIAARLHPRWILTGDLVLGTASVGLILLFQHSFTAVLIGAIGTGASMASVFPTTVTLAERFLPISGRITGWFFVGASAGSMFFPWLIGQLFEPVGPQVSMWIIFAGQALALAVLAFLLLFPKAERDAYETTT